MTSEAGVDLSELPELVLTVVVGFCNFRRDGYALARTCRRFRKIVLAMFGKPLLPPPSEAAVSIGLLRYVRAEGANVRGRPHTVGVNASDAILGTDDVGALRNLLECKFKLPYFSVCRAAMRNAPNCLEVLLGASAPERDALCPAALTAETVRGWALRLPTLRCYDLLARFPEPENKAFCAAQGGPRRLCEVLGITLAQALSAPETSALLTESVLAADDVLTLPDLRSPPPFGDAFARPAFRCAAALMREEILDVDRNWARGVLLVFGWDTTARENPAAAVNFLEVYLRRFPASDADILPFLKRYLGKLVAIAALAGDKSFLAEVAGALGPCSAEDVETAWRMCALVPPAVELLIRGGIPFPPTPPREIFNPAGPTEDVLRLWHLGGLPWPAGLCKRLTKARISEPWKSSQLLRLAYEYGCPCYHVSALKAARLGRVDLLGFVLRRAPSSLSKAALAEIFERDDPEMLSVVVGCGCRFNAASLAVGAKCRAFIIAYQRDWGVVPGKELPPSRRR